MTELDEIRAATATLAENAIALPALVLGRRGAEVIEKALAELDRARYRVVVCGEFLVGKSTLLNELLGLTLFPEGQSITSTTNTVCSVEWGETAETVVEYIDASGQGSATRLTAVDVDTVRKHATETGNPRNGRSVHLVEMRAPVDRLRSGIVLIDTPGIGGIDDAHSAATRLVLPKADAIVFVIDAIRGMAISDRDFLKEAYRHCPVVITIVTKIDSIVGDPAPVLGPIRRNVARTIGRAEADIVVIGVSSHRHREAARAGDPQLRERLLNASGFPRLEERLWTGLAATCGADRVMRTLVALHEVLNAGFAPLRYELDALDGQARGEIEAMLHHQDALAERTRARASQLPRRVQEDLAVAVGPAKERLNRAFVDAQRELEGSLNASEADLARSVAQMFTRMGQASEDAYSSVTETVRQIAERYAESEDVPVMTAAAAPRPVLPGMVLHQPAPQAAATIVRQMLAGMPNGSRMSQAGWTLGSAISTAGIFQIAPSALGMSLGPLFASGVGAALGAVVGIALGAHAYRRAVRNREARRRQDELRKELSEQLERNREVAIAGLEDAVRRRGHELGDFLSDRLGLQLESIAASKRAMTRDRERNQRERDQRRAELNHLVHRQKSLWNELEQLGVQAHALRLKLR